MVLAALPLSNGARPPKITAFPGLRDPDDPQFREALARALSTPSAPPPPVEAPAPPIEAATEEPLDLEACKRAAREALAWVTKNVSKWMGLHDATPASSQRGAPREGGGVIARFFRRIVGWLKDGFAHVRDLFVRPKATVSGEEGVARSTPAPESAPTQPAATAASAGGPEQRPASSVTTSAAAKVARDVLLHASQSWMSGVQEKYRTDKNGAPVTKAEADVARDIGVDPAVAASVRGPEQRPAPPVTSNAAAEIARDVLSHLGRHVVGTPESDAPLARVLEAVIGPA